MSYTFICTPEKEWWLKITTIEQLLEYWTNVFNPRLIQALETIQDTKEYGMGMTHCDRFQMAIGDTARFNQLSFKKAHEKIIYDYRIGQYKALCNNETVYINKNYGWNVENKIIEQFIHKNNFEFPIMKPDKIKIEKFPMGTHYYVFIDDVQLRKKENLKFNSYEEASNYAKKYIKE